IWGDSHAQQLNSGIKKYLPKEWQVLQVASSGCAPELISESSVSNWCNQSNWFALKSIKETRPDVVVVGQNLAHNLSKMSEISTRLKSLGVKKIIFTGPSPHWTSDLPKLILTKIWINTPRRTYIGINQKVLAANADLQRGFKQTKTDKFINIIDLFCNQEGCLTYLGEDKKTGVTTWDYGHLTPISSEYLAKNRLVDEIVAGSDLK
ncbi:MAG: SGNH hydrolase domain-containing protein, partial [Methylotenera sp.]